MALVPWPKTAEAQNNAITELKDLLGRDPNNDSRLKLVACSVSDRIQKAASEAPEALKTEALVRAVGFILDVGSGAETRQTIGDESITFASPANYFRRSGAEACLTDYIVRRAGKV